MGMKNKASKIISNPSGFVGNSVGRFANALIASVILVLLASIFDPIVQVLTWVRGALPTSWFDNEKWGRVVGLTYNLFWLTLGFAFMGGSTTSLTSKGKMKY